MSISSRTFPLRRAQRCLTFKLLALAQAGKAFSGAPYPGRRLRRRKNSGRQPVGPTQLRTSGELHHANVISFMTKSLSAILQSCWAEQLAHREGHLRPRRIGGVSDLHSSCSPSSNSSNSGSCQGCSHARSPTDTCSCQTLCCSYRLVKREP